MCGFLVQVGGQSEKMKFASAFNSLSHRGPDFTSKAIFTDVFSVGHHRLAICDLSDHANQPFELHNSEWKVVFNGQIYNYRQLKYQFNLKPKTDSDTEILLLLYLLLGKKFVKELNGDFAFVIYNEKTGDFFAARDRLGVKPLFYKQVKNDWYFASEAHAIARLIDNFAIDKIAKEQFLNLRGFLGGRSQFEGINNFPPAHQISENRIESYWEVTNIQSPFSKSEVKDLLIDAIECRVPNDVPYTSTLSGGIDSFLISKYSKSSTTWSVGMSMLNEFEEASNASKVLRTHHRNVQVTSEEFEDSHRNFLEKCVSPIGVANQVLSQILFRDVSKYFKVSLSGEGADELFMGYDRIYRWALLNPRFDIEKFYDLYKYHSDSQSGILEESGIHDFKGTSMQIVERFFMTVHLPILLNRLDHASMFSGVESRVPFTDHRLIELVFGSGEYGRISNKDSKIILRELYSEFFDRRLVPNHKVGFPVPLNEVSKVVKKPLNTTADWLQYSYGQFAEQIEKKAI
jgi:asparagine synthase (glutamine-hydrolysing)